MSPLRMHGDIGCTRVVANLLNPCGDPKSSHVAIRAAMNQSHWLKRWGVLEWVGLVPSLKPERSNSENPNQYRERS
jgi:hypothetical protein